METKYYTVQEAAELLRTTPNTIRIKIREGKIPVHPLEGYPLIPKEFIDFWDVNTKETFRERKMRMELEEKDKTILDLKNKIRQITRIGLEIEMLGGK